jgi:hypothetical protein
MTQASRTQDTAIQSAAPPLPQDLADVEAASSAERSCACIEAAVVPPVPVSSASAKTKLFAQLGVTSELSFFDTSFPPTRVWSSAPHGMRRLFAFLPDRAQPSFYDPVADPNDC